MRHAQLPAGVLSRDNIAVVGVRDRCGGGVGSVVWLAGGLTSWFMWSDLLIYEVWALSL